MKNDGNLYTQIVETYLKNIIVLKNYLENYMY